MSGEARNKYAQPPAGHPLRKELELLQQKKIQVDSSPTPDQKARQLATSDPATMAAGKALHRNGVTNAQKVSAAEHFAPSQGRTKPNPPSHGHRGRSL
jgi:hypothetical protein